MWQRSLRRSLAVVGETVCWASAIILMFSCKAANSTAPYLKSDTMEILPDAAIDSIGDEEDTEMPFADVAAVDATNTPNDVTCLVVTCDDDNPCTLDLCSDATCVHVGSSGKSCTMPNGGCVPAGECSNGTCLPTGGILFNRLYPHDEGIRDLLPLSQDFIVAGGRSAVFNFPKSEGIRNIAQVWRVDVNGEVVWAHDFEDYSYSKQNLGQFDSSFASALPSATGIALAGTIDQQPFLLRLDSAGKEVGLAVYSMVQATVHAAATANDGYYILGQTTGSSKNVWLAKTGFDGVVVAQWSFGVANQDFANDVVSVDGGFAFAGKSASPGDDDFDFWVVRSGTKGDVIWQKNYGGPESEQANALVAVAGGLVVVGVTLAPGGGGNGDAWMLRIDSSGTLLWDRKIGGTEYDTATDVAVLDDGYALAGGTGSYGVGEMDMWLVRTDALGNMLWQQTYGDKSNDWGAAVVPRKNGFVVGGRGYAKELDFLGKQARLIETDSWGHATCKDAGVCAGMASGACSDADPCTTDNCNADSGCSHTVFEDGSSCGAGKTCEQGTCK
jgi:hypothetical protein